MDDGLWTIAVLVDESSWRLAVGEQGVPRRCHMQTERKNRREREKLRRKMMLGLQELESWRQGDWSWNGPGME